MRPGLSEKLKGSIGDPWLVQGVGPSIS
jgi:hypothetical protein